MTSWWDLVNQTRRQDELDEHFLCGFTQDHDWKPSDVECRRCKADLSEWNEKEESNDE